MAMGIRKGILGEENRMDLEQRVGKVGMRPRRVLKKVVSRSRYWKRGVVQDSQ